MANLALHPEFGHADGDTFQALLDEQQMTQSALRQLGLTEDLKLQEVRGINQVFLPKNYHRDPKKPVAVHFMGMPRAGKSTFIESIGEVARLRNLSIGAMPEVQGPLKEISGKHQERFSYKTYDTSLTIIDTIEILMLKKQFEKFGEPDMALFDRGIIDRLPFARANFLFGRLDEGKFSASLSNIFSGLSDLNESFETAIILMLTTPEESLKREGGKQGRVMNPAFLRNLYEQYLRYHLEAIKAFEEEDPMTPYVCLDMSNTLEINAKLVAQIFGEILLFYYPQKVE